MSFSPHFSCCCLRKRENGHIDQTEIRHKTLAFLVRVAFVVFSKLKLKFWDFEDISVPNERSKRPGGNFLRYLYFFLILRMRNTFRETTNNRIKLIHSLFWSILDRFQGLKLSTYVNMCVCVSVHVELFSHVHLFVTPWTIAHQAPLSMDFSRKEHWSGLLCPSLGYISIPKSYSSVGLHLSPRAFGMVQHGGMKATWPSMNAMDCGFLRNCALKPTNVLSLEFELPCAIC